MCRENGSFRRTPIAGFWLLGKPGKAGQLAVLEWGFQQFSTVKMFSSELFSRPGLPAVSRGSPAVGAAGYNVPSVWWRLRRPELKGRCLPDTLMKSTPPPLHFQQESSCQFLESRLDCLGILLLVLAAPALSAPQEGLWQTDFEAAKSKAKAEKKLLLVDFTGSDWCGWCIKLKGEVFDKESFKTAAPKQFVLVELDFPQQKKLSDELKKQNAELQKRYKVLGFPTILVLDAEGQVVARPVIAPAARKNM